jgi:signal transduction histidine kinase
MTGQEGETRTLLVEDNPGDVILISRMLARAKRRRFKFESRGALASGVERLKHGDIDIVLLDLSLPDSRGIDSFLRAHKEAPGIPMVILTGLEDEEAALSAVRQGAQDYLVKGQVDGNLLVHALEYALERSKLLAALEKERRSQLETKDQFLSHVSHELRTPLACIHQFTTILLDGLAGEVADRQREYLEIIFRNVGQLSKMVEDILTATRAFEGKLAVNARETFLATLADETVAAMRMRALARNIEISTAVPRDLAVYADPERVSQVLSNLIDNAIKFTPDGGRVAVKAEVLPGQGFACVAVTDTGIGISQQNTERVFDRLYQVEAAISRRGGLGLGLHICKELVQAHGGRIWVESERGRGSCFFFTLPLITLGDLVAPVLESKKHGQQSLSLIQVDLFPDPQLPLGAEEQDLLSAARDLIKGCIRPDTDVVLSRNFGGYGNRRVAILVCADQAGSEKIVSRIRERLHANEALRPVSERAEISFTLIGLPLGARDLSNEQFVQQAASQTAELLGSPENGTLRLSPLTAK